MQHCNLGPNRFFIECIKEFKKEARESNDKSYFTYKKALASIERFPLPLKTVNDCEILEGIGSKICAKLNQKLQEIADSQGISPKKALKRANKELSGKSNLKTKKFELTNERKALLASLIELSSNHVNNLNGFTKFDVLPILQSQTKIEITQESKESIWKNIKSLVKEGYVEQNSKRYKITEFGRNKLTEGLKTSSTSEEMLFSDEENIKPVQQSHNNNNNNNKDNNNDNQKNSLLNEEIEECKMNLYYCKSLCDKELVYHQFEGAFKIENDTKYYRVKMHSDELQDVTLDYQYDFDHLEEDNGYFFLFLSEKHAPLYGKYQLGMTKSIPSIGSKRSPSPTNHKSTNIPPKKSKNQIKPQLGALPLIKSNSFTLPSNKKSIKPEENVKTPKFSMEFGKFDVILCVDSHENYGVGKLKEILCSSLTKKNVKFEIRPLAVGDFLWIIRDNFGQEAVLDIIVERKKFDDLSKSITDGRYREQKSRMKRCGFSHIIYLLEKCSGMNNLALSIDSLYQAVINAQTHEKFHITITENGSDTINYLVNMTNKLIDFYRNKTVSIYEESFPLENLESRRACFRNIHDDSDNTNHCLAAIEFSTFNSSSQRTRPLKISEMFAKQLMCIHGISAEKARAIIDNYSTPKKLILALSDPSLNFKDRISLISSLKLPVTNKSFGVASAKSIVAAYTRK